MLLADGNGPEVVDTLGPSSKALMATPSSFVSVSPTPAVTAASEVKSWLGDWGAWLLIGLVLIIVGVVLWRRQK